MNDDDRSVPTRPAAFTAALHVGARIFGSILRHKIRSVLGSRDVRHWSS